MLKKLANNKVINYLVVTYSLFVVFYQTLYLIVPFRQLIANLGLSWLSPMLAVIGFGIFIWDILFDRIALKMKFCIPLIVLICVMGISSLLTIKYGIISNIKAIIWQIVQMLVLFPLCNRLSTVQWEKLLKKLYWLVSLVFVPAAAVSLFQYIFAIRYIAYVDGGKFRQGLYEGRLFGVFYSPHFYSLFMMLLVAWSIYYIIKSKDKIVYKLLYGCATLFYFLNAALSGTRSIIVGAICATFVVFFWFGKRFATKFKSKTVVKYGVSVLATVCVAVCIVVSFSVVSSVMPNLIYKTSSGQGYFDKLMPDEEIDGELITQRDDAELSNSSGNRFTIWKDYLSVTSDSPKSLLFGNSPGNYMVYIRDNYPDNYIVKYITEEKYPVMYAQKLIYDTHNAYVGAFATTGVVGTGILFAFLALILFRVMRYITKKESVSFNVYMLFAIWIFILISSFFESDLFFKCTSISLIFWVVSGLLVKVTANREENI